MKQSISNSGVRQTLFWINAKANQILFHANESLRKKSFSEMRYK